jgi:predicted Zn-dependent peptidase
VNAETALPLLTKYFGRLPEKPKPEPLRAVEPEQIAEKTVILHDPSQPIYIEGYHRPAESHPDDAVYNAIADILSTGRTSRLYRRLVSDDKTAVFAGAFNGFPGSKYPNLMIFFAAPSPGNGNDEVQKAIREEIGRIVSEPVSDEELARVKTRAKAGLIRGLASNAGIAGRLATAQARSGDWREIFRDVEEIEKVTKEDIRRVAAATFTDNNRTVVRLEHEGEGQ